MKSKLKFEEHLLSKERKSLLEKIAKEQEEIGYYKLPDQDTSAIVEYAQSLDKSIETVAVIGIGGSSLGAKAVYEFLKPVKKLQRRLYFFESTDPINIESQLEKIDMEKCHVLVISKSGTTVETMAIFKYIYSLDSSSERYTFISEDGSKLDKFAKSVGINRFHLQESVGGRFSVLSVVGLLPLALSGVDIVALLQGAAKIKESFFNDGYIKELLVNKASFYAKNHAIYNINCLFAYSETMRYFIQWYVQLWGESLGKKQRNSAFNVGLTPIGLIGPKDQHSFLQLIMEGTRDKSITFIEIADFQNELEIPDISLEYLEEMDLLNGVKFSELISMQSQSVLEALLEEGDIPIDEIIIDRVDEASMGELIYYYELLTSLVGELIDVNTYDQPGVEAGKIILKEKLQQRKKSD
ncbi:MAG TPA: glucose-6-phosphate isomerase [Nitratifractor sp.]|nr:glucose-6-phosphate isomerase [Nitratifractor sp.]